MAVEDCKSFDWWNKDSGVTKIFPIKERIVEINYTTFCPTIDLFVSDKWGSGILVNIVIKFRHSEYEILWQRSVGQKKIFKQLCVNRKAEN